jgi:hypothetical protein
MLVLRTKYQIEGLNKGKAATMSVMDELYATDVAFHRGASEDIRGLND